MVRERQRYVPVERDAGVVLEPEQHVDLVVGGGGQLARELRRHAFYGLHVHGAHPGWNNVLCVIITIYTMTAKYFITE